MSNEQRWECGYCGDCWTERLILWESAPQRCLKCGETQLLKKLKPGTGKSGNVFGYPDAEPRKAANEYFED